MSGMTTSEYRRAWLARHPLYAQWQFVRRVCGVIRGRTRAEAELYDGIQVSPEFGTYAAFEEFVMGLGWRKGLFVVRKDKTRGFEPGNLAAVPYSEAVNMRRNTKRVGGVPLRKLVGGEGVRADPAYRRASDRYFRLGYDLGSSVARAVVPAEENGRITGRIRGEGTPECPADSRV